MSRFSRVLNNLTQRPLSSLAKINPENIAFLGLGNLAAKIGPRLILDAENSQKIIGYSPSGRQTPYANTFTNIARTLQSTDLKYVFYMFKPQHWDTKLKTEIQVALQHHTTRPLIVSVLAGLGIKELGCDICCMPNVLSKVGRSYTFAIADESVTEKQKLQFAYDCRNMGPILWVSEPRDMHLAVACSGSAPAYIMHGMSVAVNIAKLSGNSHEEATNLVIDEVQNSANMLRDEFANNATVNWDRLYSEASQDQFKVFILRSIEAYCRAMQKLGLPRDTSYDVAWNTVLGTTELIRERFHEHQAEQQNKAEEQEDYTKEPFKITKVMAEIMSKGGTTRKAIDVAEAAKFEIFDSEQQLDDFAFSMLNAAYQRSIEMQNESKKKALALTELSIYAENKNNTRGDFAIISSITPRSR